MAVSKRTRFEVLRRDNYTCRYCRSVDNPLTIDHVLPVALGGTDDPSNLVACCADCNSGKSSATPDQQTVADVTKDAEMWAAAMKAAASIAAVAREAADARFGEWLDRWNGFTYVETGRPVEINHASAKRTVLSMIDAGLTVEDLMDATESAMTARSADDRFRYFCGIAWNMLRTRQEQAKSLLEEAREMSARRRAGSAE